MRWGRLGRVQPDRDGATSFIADRIVGYTAGADVSFGTTTVFGFNWSRVPSMLRYNAQESSRNRTVTPRHRFHRQNLDGTHLPRLKKMG